MPETSNPLRDYLAAEERLTAVYSATLSEDAPWTPVSLGVTNRRLLCVSEGGTFVNVDHDAICAVRSRLRSTSSLRGIDYRLLMAIGGLVVLLSFAGVVTFASSTFVPLLLPVLAGGLASVEYQRRTAGGIDWSAILGTPSGSRGQSETSRSQPEPRGRSSENDQVLTLVNGVIAAVSLAGIVVLSSSWLVVLLSVSTVGGLAAIDYVHRNRDDWDGFEIVRRREREVSITTNDGSTVLIRCDPSDHVDRELSRLAFVDRDEVVPPISTGSRSATSASSPDG